jgi:hypothetical protein
MGVCQSLVTEFEYGTRLKEDSSRELVKNNSNLKLICRKIGLEDIDKRLIYEEFDLVQKITSTKRNQERMALKKGFKKYYGVNMRDGPYRVNSGG